ncbi:MAG: Nif3-like dinuclear metal center hexameric protein [Ruminococcus sp.]|nr:Nif3-like dinuclear metal center hexameric protein [Ruminococcus sp.]
MSRRLVEGVKAESIHDIYKFLDEKYPFSLQEKWDNSGLLVENMSMRCKKILLTLDITRNAVNEAKRKGAELIISHHPVIFNPLKKVKKSSPVFELIKNDISAICIHTNLDIAEGGTNSIIVKRIAEKCELSDKTEPLEDSGLGYIVELKNSISECRFADILKDIFGCMYVEINRFCKKNISRIAVCSGSGGSLLGLAVEKGCDALVTGDVKHDVWIDANKNNFTVFDCGHFHTENIVLWELRRVLEEKFPMLDIEIAESSVNPCVYLR